MYYDNGNNYNNGNNYSGTHYNNTNDNSYRNLADEIQEFLAEITNDAADVSPSSDRQQNQANCDTISVGGIIPVEAPVDFQSGSRVLKKEF